MQIILRNLFQYLRLKKVYLSESQMDLLSLCSDLNCWIAGGAPLALYQGKPEQIKDWDMYFRSENELKEAKKELLDCGFNQQHESDNSVSLSKNEEVVQLINRRYHCSLEDVFSSFDFVVCCFGIEDDCLFFTPQSKTDADKGQININNESEVHINTIGRIARYGSKGFTPTNECMLEIARILREMSCKEFYTMKQVSS